MKVKKSPAFLAVLLVIAAALLIPLLSAGPASSEETAFQKNFIEAKQAEKFQGMKYLVQQNKAIIPGEVAQLMKDAMAEGLDTREKMRLLDLAYQIAKMHQEWNDGDAKIVEKIEGLLNEERVKKQERAALAESIKRVEVVPGNFVMNDHAEEMEKAGVAPVIYPHWVHRSFFRCKVCHENIEIMKRGANQLSHEKLDSGMLCGACHNGEMSFNTTDEKNCSRCHLFGTPEAEALIDLGYYNKKKFTDMAARLGSKWHGDKLPDGKYPLSRLGFINWVELDRLGAFEPLSSLGEDAPTEGVRETQILFVLPKKFSFMLDNVLWSHKIHTTWINCSICHETRPERERIFTRKAGETRVSMIDIKEGKSCGTCHDRVSFHISDCKRCHNHKGVEVDKNTIVRESLAPAETSAPAEEKPRPGEGLMKSTY